MPWVVIKFLPSEEVEALPDLWFNEEKQFCLYPSYTRQKLEKAIKSQEKPESDWKQYNAKLLSSTRYENFNIASAKATKACFTSDISDVEVLPEKRTVRKTVYSSDEVESDESLLDVPMVPVQTSSSDIRKNNETRCNSVMQQRYREARKCANEESHSIIRDTNANAANKNCEKEHIEHRTETYSYDGFRKHMIQSQVKHSKMLKEVENSVNNLQISLAENKDILKDILNTVSGKSTSAMPDGGIVDVYSSKLPIRTVEDVTAVEEELLEENNFKLLVKTFSRLGGVDYKDLIRRVLTRTMTDEIIKLYSLHGHKGKTKLFSALTEAVKIFDSQITLKEIELKTSASLAKAAERLKAKNVSK